MRMIFVNLPVTDLARSRAFYEALGFSINENFSDENAACVVVSETIFAMLLTRDYFETFVTGEVADPRAATGALLALSAESRAECERFRATALANGGGEWRPNQDHGNMFSVSFADPDGHVWEVLWMDAAAASGEEPVGEAQDA